MKKFACFLLVLMAALCPGALAAQPAVPGMTSESVQARMIADTTAIVPGQNFRIGVELLLSPGWHIYYKVPGETGRPTTLEVASSAGLAVSELQWERPSRFDEGGTTSFGYATHTVIAATLKAPADIKPGDNLTLHGKVTWLACNQICVPGETEVELTLPIVASAGAAQANNSAKFAPVNFAGNVNQITGSQPSTVQAKPAEISFPVALILAFLGGMLLNLMPCVLPVLSLKIFGFVHESGSSRKRILALGLAYAAGTIGSFLLMALVVIAAQYAGHTIGWGFQFQQPIFVLAMAAFVTVMALGLFGLFFVQVSDGTGKLEDVAQREGLLGAAAKGVSATLLSTPCTAPFFGTAISYAFSQTWWVVLAIFFTVGLGLSAPYLLLTWKPGWMRFLPKPGLWMEHFKEFMGFLLLATVAWLLYVLGNLGGLPLVNASIVFLLVISVCAWGIAKFATAEHTKSRRAAIWCVCLVTTGLAFWSTALPAINSPSKSGTLQTSWIVNGVQWERYSEQALLKNLADGHPVIVDFTADWCINCKLNERVFQSSSVAAKLRDTHAVVLKADWTAGDPEITKLLARFGKSGIPLFVVYSPLRQEQPVVLPELITGGMITAAVDAAIQP